MVTPEQVSVGVLVTAVSRDAVDEAVAACGVGERRRGGKLPPHVTAYLTLGMCLFPDDDYAEVAAKVTGSLDRFGCWDAGWAPPSASGITQARKRLGRAVMAEVFERVAGQVATLSTRGAWLRGRLLLAIDGFDVDVPDTEENAAEFGYAGAGEKRSAFPKLRVVALAECGTHALRAAEVGGWASGERTLARGLPMRLHRDEVLTADRGFYSFANWSLAAGTGADLIWRAPTGLRLPVVQVLADGTFLTVLINPEITGGRRRERLLAAAKAGGELDPDEAHLARVVEYDIPDRAGNGTGELVALLTTILDPAQARAD
ncbi:IS4 family transposase, partial [Frankia sp. AgB32]|uniref:IS4 family transposase n=1 Tax=Frankia sp. AgB32 TaxID=631119 RepID=UPI00200BA547